MSNKNRLSWDNYFLNIAKSVSLRSPDSTKHGAVIVNDRKRIIGVGYNGFPSGLDDESWPLTRPEKYEIIIHAELNAILNCHSKQENMTCYVTGETCNKCLFELYQFGVTRLVNANSHGSYSITQKDRENREKFIKQTGMIVEVVEHSVVYSQETKTELKKNIDERDVKYLTNRLRYFEKCMNEGIIQFFDCDLNYVADFIESLYYDKKKGLVMNELSVESLKNIFLIRPEDLSDEQIEWFWSQDVCMDDWDLMVIAPEEVLELQETENYYTKEKDVFGVHRVLFSKEFVKAAVVPGGIR